MFKRLVGGNININININWLQGQNNVFNMGFKPVVAECNVRSIIGRVNGIISGGNRGKNTRSQKSGY